MRNGILLTVIALAVVSLLVIPSAAKLDRAEATSRAIIQEAYDSGDIDLDRKMLLKAYALYAPDRLPDSYRGGRIDKCGVPIADEIDRVIDELSPEVADEIRSLRARPSCTDYIETDHFRIHYNTSGTHKILNWPDTTYRDAIATAAENSWNEEVDRLGFNPPPADGGDPDGGGGNDLYDIYVQNLSGVYGYCEGCYTVPSTPETDCTSFVVIDNDYAGFGYADPQDPMKVTVAHEFCHALQNAHDYSEDVWYKECTSVWMEDHIYDSINDYTQYIAYFTSKPYRSIEWNDVSGLRIYGSCIWNFYLAENYGADIIRENWSACEGGLQTMQHIDVVLGGYGSSIEEAYADFALWNFFTGARCDGAHYDEGSTWPLVATTMQYSLYPVEDGAPYSTYLPDHFGANYIRFSQGAGGYDALQIAYDGPWPGSVPNAAFLATRDQSGNTAEYGEFSLNMMGNGEMTVEGWDTLSYVTLIVANQTDNVNDMSYLYDANQTETGVEEAVHELALKPASPNPFTGATSIAYTVPAGGGLVDVTIYDVKGREVRKLVNEQMPSGDGIAVWDGLDGKGEKVAAGVYFARLNVDGLTASGKLMYLK
ncbi:MAG: T9SS type A sorting domain-containing protein [Candidatus Eisenbacteria bacterium]|nr:T9SS type A sorting domain-containing protein [Candidatus Eisenbacteria bacterium]